MGEQSIEAARAELMAASQTIGACVALLRDLMPLFERFEREQQIMDSIGPILDPTLFKSSERLAVAAILDPIFKAAGRLVTTYDERVVRSGEALAKVRGE